MQESYQQNILYSTPPNLQDCKRHRKANMIFKSLNNADASQLLIYNYCECCGRIVGELPHFRLRYDPLEAAYLGPGIPLFFAFFRSVLYLLLVYLIEFGFYTTFTNFNGKNCEKGCGFPTFWNKISVFNIFDEYLTLQVQMYFLLAILIITIFVNLSIRSYMNYLELYIDQFFVKPSDYSIIIRGTPADASKEDILDMIRQREPQGLRQDDDNERSEIGQIGQLKVVDVIMVMELQKFLQRQSENLQKLKQQLRLKQKNMEIVPVHEINDVVPQKFARTAIVIFSKSQSKNYFLGTYGAFQKMLKTLWGSYYAKSNVHKIKGQFVSVYRAPEPDDLIWSNCGKQNSSLLLRRTSLYLLSIVVLAIGSSMQYLVALIRNKYVSLQKYEHQFLFSLAAAIIVSTFNFLLSLVLQFMASRQGHDTKTQFSVAITFRIVIFQFINSGMLVVFSNIFVQFTTEQRSYDFRETVLTSNIVQMMVVNAILGNLFPFIINKFELMKLFPRWKILNGKQLYLQTQANNAFQAPDINIHLKYAYIFKTFWLTVFFMPTVPAVIIVSFCGLLFNYWLQKYLFSGAYTAPETISSYLSNNILNLLDYTPLWMSLGSLFVHFLRKDFQFVKIETEIKNFHYLFLALSIINIFLPYYGILKRFTKYRERQNSQSTYEQSACTFQLTYEDTNPVKLVKNRRKVRDQEFFKQKIVRDTDFKDMRLHMSQSQILNYHKQSIMLRKSSVLTDGIEQCQRTMRAQRFSSLVI